MDTTEKFQDLLREVFQFESSDLDFGIFQKRLWEKRKFVLNTEYVITSDQPEFKRLMEG